VQITERRSNYRMRLDVAVATLPGGPNKMAATLDSYGVRGDHGGCTTCPLAMYLTARVGKIVHVGGTEASIEHEGRWYSCPLPLAARLFVRNFDAFRLRHLEGQPTWGTLVTALMLGEAVRP